MFEKLRFDQTRFKSSVCDFKFVTMMLNISKFCKKYQIYWVFYTFWKNIEETIFYFFVSLMIKKIGEKFQIYTFFETLCTRQIYASKTEVGDNKFIKTCRQFQNFVPKTATIIIVSNIFYIKSLSIVSTKLYQSNIKKNYVVCLL